MRVDLLLAGLVAAGAGWYAYQRITAGNRWAGGRLVDKWESEIMGQLGMDTNQGATEAPPLRYFTPAEFGEWWPLMSPDLLLKLDEFRARLGVPVMISPAPGALGRHLGSSLSQHNVDMWGEVRAADVMPLGADLQTAYRVAREVGFHGIGLYPDWKPHPGLHLDVRPGPLALWSGLLDNEGNQYYTGIEAALS